MSATPRQSILQRVPEHWTRTAATCGRDIAILSPAPSTSLQTDLRTFTINGANPGRASVTFGYPGRLPRSRFRAVNMTTWLSYTSFWSDYEGRVLTL